MSYEESTGGMWRFFVPGDPRPQGSKVYFTDGNGRAMGKESSQYLRRWRKAIADTATVSMLGPKPRINKAARVRLELEFHIARPKTTDRAAPTAARDGDLDKLTRAVGDALTGVAWHDDGQVVELHASKEWAVVGPGVWIKIEEF